MSRETEREKERGREVERGGEKQTGTHRESEPPDRQMDREAETK